MASEKSYMRKRRHASLKRVKDLRIDTPGPIRVICIVVEAVDGVALVQDIMDIPGKQGTIRVNVEGQLAVAEKYMLIGDVKMTTGPDGKDLRLSVSSSYNINALDIKAYKESLTLEERINQAFVR
ncbi:MAG: hypothetical protein ACFFED_01955 [Candidatus Thorarchaeota archaeon]